MKLKLVIVVLILSISIMGQVPMVIPFTKKNQKRIDDITNMLNSEPTGFGAPYHNRKIWNNFISKVDKNNIISEAEKIKSSEIPNWDDEKYLEFSRNGVRPPGEKMIKDRLNRLTPLVWAECIENNGRFISTIESTLKSLISSRSWILPAHDRTLDVFYGKKYEVELVSALFANELGQSLYMLNDKVSPEVRKEVIAALYTHIFNPVKKSLETGVGNGWLNNTNNWNAVCLAGVTGAALSVIESKQERALFVAAAEYYAQNSLIGYTDDGYCSEGLGYYNYGFSNYIVLREEIYQNTNGKIDLFNSPKMRNIALYGLDFEILNGVYPAFSDCKIGTTISTDILWYCNKNLGLGLSTYNERKYNSTWDIASSAMMGFPNTASLSPIPLSSIDIQENRLRKFFDNAGVLIVRPLGNTKTALAAAFKGGNNAESHNHNDIGSFVIVKGAEMLVGDPGGPYNYTGDMWTDKRYTYKSLSSFGHPVPYINNMTQRPGLEAKAKIIKTDFSNNKDEYVMDITSAYPISELKNLTRKFIYKRSGDERLTIEDSFDFEQPGEFESALITLGEWKLKDKNVIEFIGKKEKILVKIIPPKGTSFTIVSEKIQENGPEFTRIGIRLKEKIKTGTFKLEFDN